MFWFKTIKKLKGEVADLNIRYVYLDASVESLAKSIEGLLSGVGDVIKENEFLERKIETMEEFLDVDSVSSIGRYSKWKSKK